MVKKGGKRLMKTIKSGAAQPVTQPVTQSVTQPVTQPQPLTQQIYDSTADFGVFMALLGLIGASVIGSIMFSIGIYLIFTKGTHSKEVSGKVLQSKCDIYRNSKNKTRKDCNTTVKYTVDGKDYENIVSTNKLKLKDSTIDLVYNPKEPSDSVAKTGARRFGAYILIGISLLMVIGAIIRYYIVKTYKVAAAATGVGEAASIVATPFQSSSSPVGSFDSNFSPMELVDSIESK